MEYDHIHLLSFGVTFSKAINRMRKLKGGVYKHRYHFRQISGVRQLKNVLNYIFTNGVKHKTAKSMVNPYNSIRASIKKLSNKKSASPHKLFA